MKNLTIPVALGLLCLNISAFARPRLTNMSLISGIYFENYFNGQKLIHASHAPPLRGSVTDSLGAPLQGATIRLKNGPVLAVTDRNGLFQIAEVTDGAILQISFLGYLSSEVIYTRQSDLPIVLAKSSSTLQEVSVISTGYQTLPRERATGSFTQIDNRLLNRSTGTNILDRLNGITSGLRFTGQASTAVSTNPNDRILGINIRGESTLSGNVSRDPLIVLDNFPYEGNISNINPNDIESITVLKDAAAASIWGARSGNGVIVITTKKGRRNQALSVEVNANLTLQNKPDLNYDPNWLSANDYIDVESQLFSKGYFDNFLSDAGNQPVVSPVIDLLAAARNGQLSSAEAASRVNALRQYDVRRDYDRYIYQRAVRQQYSIGLKGGSDKSSHSFSAGYDRNAENLVRNGYQRLTLNTFNTYTPLKNLTLTTAFNYTLSRTALNNQYNYGSGITVGGPVAGIYPYARFADDAGTPLAIVRDYRSSYVDGAPSRGLLDWRFRPLDELAIADRYTKVNDLLIRAGAKYKIADFLTAEVQYQHEGQQVNTDNYQSPLSYNARNIVNRFTIINPSTGALTYLVPRGGILNLGRYELSSHNLRGQLNFDHIFHGVHAVNGLAGSEIRDMSSNSFLRTSYGYDDNFGTSSGNLNYADQLPVNPAGTARIPAPEGQVIGTTNRYVSYYANAAYTYDNRYVFSLSGRRDGSNIFGVKTNDKITPLWSAGLSWNASNEEFYHLSWLPTLKVRATYGFNGNVYNGSAYVTGNYSTVSLTGAQAILNLTAPNPSLRWEKVRNINAGVDFATKGDRLSGTIEWFRKDGQDLIQSVPLFTSTGFAAYFGNSASTRTSGVDITLNSKNIVGRFQWSTTLLLNTLKDKVTKYDIKFTSTSLQRVGGLAVQGKPLYGIYSYHWSGLDPQNGDPIGKLNGIASKDYANIIANFQPDSLVYHGSGRPTVYGGFRNDFAYGQFSLSLNVVYSLGYYFRRPSTSVNLANLISSGNGQHIDYTQRWQQPGDENRKNVPSVLYPNNLNRNTFYQYSEVLVEKGDHIRLQDVRLGWNFNTANKKKVPFKELQAFVYASNLGIIWRANKLGLDPDVPANSHTVPLPLTITAGIQTRF